MVNPDSLKKHGPEIRCPECPSIPTMPGHPPCPNLEVPAQIPSWTKFKPTRPGRYLMRRGEHTVREVEVREILGEFYHSKQDGELLWLSIENATYEAEWFKIEPPALTDDANKILAKLGRGPSEAISYCGELVDRNDPLHMLVVGYNLGYQERGHEQREAERDEFTQRVERAPIGRKRT